MTMKFVWLGFHLSSQEAYESLIDKLCSYFHEGNGHAYFESLHNLFRSTLSKDVFTYLL